METRLNRGSLVHDDLVRSSIVRLTPTGEVKPYGISDQTTLDGACSHCYVQDTTQDLPEILCAPFLLT